MKNFIILLASLAMTYRLVASENILISPQYLPNKRQKILTLDDVDTLLNIQLEVANNSPKDEQSFFKKNNDALETVSSYLSAKDLTVFSLSNRFIYSQLSNTSDSIGARHRINYKFSITDHNGKTFYIDEYLAKSDSPKILKVDKIDMLINKDPNKFIKLVYKSAPDTLETIPSSLRYFYEQTMQIDKLIEGIPHQKTSKNALIDFCREYINWNQFWDLIWDLIWVHVGDVDDLAQMIELSTQVASQVGGMDWDQIGNQLSQLIFDQVGIQIAIQTEVQIMNHSLRASQDHLRSFLSSLDFQPNHGERLVRNDLLSAINYCFMIFQLEHIAITHSNLFETKKENENCFLIKFIKDHITEEDAQIIIANLVISEDHCVNFLIKNHLQILKRKLLIKT